MDDSGLVILIAIVILIFTTVHPQALKGGSMMTQTVMGQKTAANLPYRMFRFTLIAITTAPLIRMNRAV
jgi:hypothetical protein